MAALAPVPSPNTAPKPEIALPPSFGIRSQDARLRNAPTPPPATSDQKAPLGLLTNFTGTYKGNGLNLIFRPNSGPPTTTTFPNPVAGNAIPQPPNENVLEINLTSETLTFSKDLQSVPNRGLEAQNDIFLNGIPYIQVINDVTNLDTGRNDESPGSGIHFEPGLWMHVPATTTDPIQGETLVRMASIPHGTTINAQQSVKPTTVAGAPDFTKSPNVVDITPFSIGQPTNRHAFAAQTATNINTPRLPQDLSKFIATGFITQDILSNPNLVLQNANKGKTIKTSTFFVVDTAVTPPQKGGGIANIDFLTGSSAPAPQATAGGNANAAQMVATFWINVVEYSIQVPAWKPGHAPLHITPPKPNPDSHVPTFVVTPPHEVTAPITIKVTSPEIQYSQNVSLNFAALTWPHVSVATLTQSVPVPVPDSAFSA